MKLFLTPKRHEDGVEDGAWVVEEIGDPLVEADVGQLPHGAGFTERTHLESKHGA